MSFRKPKRKLFGRKYSVPILDKTSIALVLSTFRKDATDAGVQLDGEPKLGIQPNLFSSDVHVNVIAYLK